MMTLPEEIMFIWCRPKAMSAVLFLINRYVAVLGNTLDLINNLLPVSAKRFQPCFLDICYFTQQRLSCSKYLELEVYREKDTEVPKISVILTLRTYALYGRNRRLLKWMIIIGLALIAGALVRVRNLNRRVC
ncbi:uncharacterized protein EDB93DRAFT_1139514 [Suillus bovinus]|uniref:uncharacterized protein n=1 Tax=Suillus bovinus TaxID=48563 RepID=UPI001B871314|nr:uncharacterized protein EDB93DRAFT_1139514 [Suillus bovinus]KAG2151164.1 hypothetical protein EDB93DRAFT_1139514 [Suillus bovinus]